MPDYIFVRGSIATFKLASEQTSSSLRVPTRPSPFANPSRLRFLPKDYAADKRDDRWPSTSFRETQATARETAKFPAWSPVWSAQQCCRDKRSLWEQPSQFAGTKMASTPPLHLFRVRDSPAAGTSPRCIYTHRCA